jgi:beta-barrel assembly-enhancing protease
VKQALVGRENVGVSRDGARSRVEIRAWARTASIFLSLMLALFATGASAWAQQSAQSAGAPSTANQQATPMQLPQSSAETATATAASAEPADPELDLPDYGAAADLDARDVTPPPLDSRHADVAERLERGLKVDPKYDINHIGDRGIGNGVNLYSLEKEQTLGRQLSMDVEHESRLITDPVITEFVNRIGQSIVRNSDARVPFAIKVVDNEEINAFALPGGFFYVNSGLILAADNEAELAGVMAHEVAHVAARHATRNATRAQIFNIASIPLIFVGGPIGYAVRQVAGLAVPMSFLKFSRDAEREADLLGLEYQYKAGYDPGAFVQFFEKLRTTEKQKHSMLSKAFATHPMTEDRIKRAQEEIERVLPPRNEYVVTTSEFDDVKARLIAIEDEHMIDAGHGLKPTLRKRNGDSRASSGDSKDDRPTLKRRDSSSSAGSTKQDGGSSDDGGPMLRKPN